MDPLESPAGEVRFTVDAQFAAHFAQLKQVFLYINDQCNLKCEQCIYKPHVTYHGAREIPLATVRGLLRAFRNLGARKVTFLGGEPSLYGARSGHAPLHSVLSFAKQIGYDYRRLDTNGQFHPRLFHEGGLTSLSELAFSIDGYNPETNDLLRGDGSFVRAVDTLQHANSLGVRTTITCCIHRRLMDRDDEGVYGVERVVRMGERLGVHTVNFHDLFKAGVPMDTWTGDFDCSPEEHVKMYAELRDKIEKGRFSVHVRLPQCFVSQEEFDRNPRYYGYCPVKMGERVMVHTDGVIRICSNLICSSFGTARFEDDRIVWNRSQSNELLHHDLNRATPCTNRSRNRSYRGLVPLCFSFKPNQEEHVWQSLDWDERRTVPLVPDSRVSSGYQLPVVPN